MICAGAAGTAYVGYATDNDIPGGQFIYSQNGCAFAKYTDCDPSALGSGATLGVQAG